jgi:hypothetical protein
MDAFLFLRIVIPKAVNERALSTGVPGARFVRDGVVISPRVGLRDLLFVSSDYA